MRKKNTIHKRPERQKAEKRREYKDRERRVRKRYGPGPVSRNLSPSPLFGLQAVRLHSHSIPGPFMLNHRPSSNLLPIYSISILLLFKAAFTTAFVSPSAHLTNSIYSPNEDTFSTESQSESPLAFLSS